MIVSRFIHQLSVTLKNNICEDINFCEDSYLTYTYIYTHIYIHMYIHINIYTYAHTYIHNTHIHTYTYIYIVGTHPLY